MASASIVRRAVPDDERELWRMFQLMHHENGFFPLSERKVDFYLQRGLRPEAIANDDQGPRTLIGVIGANVSLEGVIMLVLGSPWYSDTITMEDCVDFVDPRYRKSDHAKALLGYAKNMVDEVRVKHPDFTMTAGVVSKKRTAAKIRLFSRHFSPVGVFFVYPAPADVEPLKHVYKV